MIELILLTLNFCPTLGILTKNLGPTWGILTKIFLKMSKSPGLPHLRPQGQNIDTCIRQIQFFKRSHKFYTSVLQYYKSGKLAEVECLCHFPGGLTPIVSYGMYPLRDCLPFFTFNPPFWPHNEADKPVFMLGTHLIASRIACQCFHTYTMLPQLPVNVFIPTQVQLSGLLCTQRWEKQSFA